jgi:hypothetical protein
MAGATATYNCQRCQQPFTARVADRNRGWARFCSKSCKAIRQVQKGGPAGPGQGIGWGKGNQRAKYPRHDGRSPMKHKVCDTCGNAAINGVHTADGIEWYCERHEYEATLHPFSSEALGQD